jgi:hypothetical protein
MLNLVAAASLACIAFGAAILARRRRLNPENFSVSREWLVQHQSYDRS